MATFFEQWLKRRMMLMYKDEYIVFADPAVEALCAANWGDGVGLKYRQAARVTTLGSVFRNNTTITTFDELQYFTGLTTINQYAFEACTALAQVTLPPTVVLIEAHSFENCSSLSTVLYTGEGTFAVGERAFRYCSLTSFPTTKINYIYDGYAFHRHLMTRIELNNSLSYIGSRAFISLLSDGTPQTVIMHNNTPPTLGNNQVFHRDNGGGSFYINTGIKIYVPWSIDHSILSAYKITGNWTVYANYIEEIDPVPTAYRRLTGIVFDGAVWYDTGLPLQGSDTVKISFSATKACNVFGCYTSGDAQDNYSLYVSTTSSAKYTRYNGGTYNSYIAANTRYDVTITPTGTDGMRNDSTWTAKTFTCSTDMLIGSTSVGATSAKFTGTLYGEIEIEGRALFIPVERISDGEIGYYNPVTDEFLMNESTGTPTALGYA